MKFKTLSLLATCAVVAHGATRESFDDGWRFARFGAMPDGSRLPEPGASVESLVASSSEKEHPPADAVDGNPDTRWCAADGAAGQSITMDFGIGRNLESIEIDWEKPAVYPHEIVTSLDGTHWTPVESATDGGDGEGHEKVRASIIARYVRVVVGKVPNDQWASIRELRLLNASGDAIRPVPPPGSGGLSPAAVDFDDSGWRSVRLPHDWGIEGPFRMDLDNSTGRLPWAGIGWYRRTLDLTESDLGQPLFLDFDGAMSHPQIHVNGQLAGEWVYGYSSFRVDISRWVKAGANSISVRLDNPPLSSRWYPGGGLYRHVWLVRANPIHLAPDGVFARSENVSAEEATVVVSTEIAGTEELAGLTVSHQLLDATGKPVAEVSGPATETAARLVVSSPQRWDITKPYLHTLRTVLKKGETELDTSECRFGIRSSEWKGDGFYLNGKRVQIKGVCNHHDLGALGAAFNTRAAERQLELLQEMGCNSIRASHNPPAPQLVDLCDRMGILLLDELFDCWKAGKRENDYHLYFDAWYQRDVAALIRRDRNHASVIGWSTGNEVREQGNKQGFGVSEQLRAEVRKHDPTRMVTAGCNNLAVATNGFAETVDVLGFNYPVRKMDLPAKLHQERPKLPIFGSETSSCVSTRGYYSFPVKWDKASGFSDYQVSGYELYAPGWANRPDLDFELLEKNPFMAGEYVWTGFDYLGEPTPYNSDSTIALNFQDPAQREKALEDLKQNGGQAPSRSSYFGILDLCGFPKDRYYLYQSHWRPDFPMAHILPHWNWPDRVGQVTPVHVFTSGDEAELFLNGKSLGRKKKEKFNYRIVWEDVIYQPGSLTVKTWKDGKPWAEADRSTTGTATRLLATADRSEIRADGDDLCYITVTVADKDGRLVPQANHRLRFRVEGPAEVVGICNGDPTSLEPLQGNSLPAFNGLCQVILRGKPGSVGAVTFLVGTEKMASGRAIIQTR